MMGRIKGLCCLAGLTALAAMIAHGSPAHAASLGIKGVIVPLPGGSPFLYEFELSLTSGSIAPGSSFTVGTSPGGLVGISAPGYFSPGDPGSAHFEPSVTGNPFAPQVYSWEINAGGIVTTLTGNAAPYDYESSVTWDYLSGPSIVWQGTDVNLGLFIIETTTSFADNAPPVIPNVTPISYTYSLVPQGGGAPSTGGNTITLSSVPEPSSVVLCLIGGAGLPVLLRWRMRLQPTQSA